MKKLITIVVISLLGQTLLMAMSDLNRSSAHLPDSLESKFNNALSEEKKVDALNDISFYLVDKNPELAESYARDAMQLADSKEYKKGLMESNNIIGIAFYRLAKYQQALTCFNTAVELASQLNLDNKKAAVYNNISLVYNSLAEYEKALSYNNKAFEIYTENKDTAGLAKTFNNTGLIYHSKGDYVSANMYYKKALLLKQSQTGKDLISNTYNNIGQLFYEMYSDTFRWALDSALYYFIKAYTGYNSTSNKVGLAQVLPNIANIYSVKNLGDKALDANRAALNAQKEVNDSVGLGNTYYNMALLYLQNKEEAMALTYFMKSLAIAEQFSLLELKRDISKELFYVYQSKREYQKANSYATSIIEINDSLNVIAHKDLLLDYMGKFEFQKFENLKLYDSKLYQKKWLIVSSLFGFLMSLILIIVILRIKKNT